MPSRGPGASWSGCEAPAGGCRDELPSGGFPGMAEQPLRQAGRPLRLWEELLKATRQKLFKSRGL